LLRFRRVFARESITKPGAFLKSPERIHRGLSLEGRISSVRSLEEILGVIGERLHRRLLGVDPRL
jgi:hypothetical protein